MGSRILNYMLKRKLHLFIITFLMIKILSPVLGYFLWTVNQDSILPVSRQICVFFVKASLYIIYALAIYQYTVSALYKEKTGRSYAADRKYRRSFGELVHYFKDADKHVLNVNEQFEEESWKDAEGIIFGTVGKRLIRLPSNAEANIFVVGSPGSRKTTGIAKTTCFCYAGSILAVDLKGDLYGFCGSKRKILRFCPDLMDDTGKNIALKYSAHFNPFDGVSEMDDSQKKVFLQNLSITLIQIEEGKKDTFFEECARSIFMGIIYILMEKKPDISFPEVLHAILHGWVPDGIEPEGFPQDIFEWVTAVKECNLPEAIEQLKSLDGNNTKNVAGAMNSLTRSLSIYSTQTLDSLLDGKGECISRDALEAGYDVFLQISQKNMDVYAPLFNLILTSFMSGLSDRPDKSTGAKLRPVLVLLDEFPQLSFRYKTISLAMATLRSKSVQCMIIAQSISQLSQLYGPDGWKSLLGNCTYQLILKSNEELTQQHFSALFGTRKVLKISNSTSTTSKDSNAGRSVQEAREPIYEPEDFGDLENKLLIYFDGKRIEAEKINPHE